MSFCNKHSLSHPRMRRLASTYDNLKTRVATALDQVSRTLDITDPPHQMKDTKLTILRLIQVWLFHESIIELNPQRIKKLDIDTDGTCTILLSGDTINKTHLDSILDDKHKFVLTNESNSVYNGFWKPVELDDNSVSQNFPTADKIEEKLLSIGIERGVDVLIVVDSSTINVLLSNEVEEMMEEILTGSSFALSFVHDIVCTSHVVRSGRGRSGRDCSRWSSNISNDKLNQKVDKDSKIFRKFVSSLKPSKISKSFKKLRDHVKKFQKNCINTLCFRLQKGDRFPFDIHAYGVDSGFSRQDVSDLFETSPENVELYNLSGAQRQVLKFGPDEVKRNYFNFEYAPEGFRLISAMISSQRKPILRFEPQSDSDEDPVVEARLKLSLTRDRWRQLVTKEATFLDGNSVAGSIVPVGECNLYACCANVLEIQGGLWRAEGLTILPSDDNFLSLAMDCGGLPCYFKKKTLELPNQDTKSNLAEIFCDEFWSDLGINLDYSEKAVMMLLNIFTPSKPDSPVDDNAILQAST
jgi:hypothetical protein